MSGTVGKCFAFSEVQVQPKKSGKSKVYVLVSRQNTQKAARAMTTAIAKSTCSKGAIAKLNDLGILVQTGKFNQSGGIPLTYAGNDLKADNLIIEKNGFSLNAKNQICRDGRVCLFNADTITLVTDPHEQKEAKARVKKQTASVGGEDQVLSTEEGEASRSVSEVGLSELQIENMEKLKQTLKTVTQTPEEGVDPRVYQALLAQLEQEHDLPEELLQKLNETLNDDNLQMLARECLEETHGKLIETGFVQDHSHSFDNNVLFISGSETAIKQLSGDEFVDAVQNELDQGAEAASVVGTFEKGQPCTLANDTYLDGQLTQKLTFVVNSKLGDGRVTLCCQTDDGPQKIVMKKTGKNKSIPACFHPSELKTVALGEAVEGGGQETPRYTVDKAKVIRVTQFAPAAGLDSVIQMIEAYQSGTADPQIVEVFEQNTDESEIALGLSELESSTASTPSHTAAATAAAAETDSTSLEPQTGSVSNKFSVGQTVQLISDFEDPGSEARVWTVTGITNGKYALALQGQSDGAYQTMTVNGIDIYEYADLYSDGTDVAPAGGIDSIPVIDEPQINLNGDEPVSISLPTGYFPSSLKITKEQYQDILIGATCTIKIKETGAYTDVTIHKFQVSQKGQAFATFEADGKMVQVEKGGKLRDRRLATFKLKTLNADQVQAQFVEMPLRLTERLSELIQASQFVYLREGAVDLKTIMEDILSPTNKFEKTFLTEFESVISVLEFDPNDVIKLFKKYGIL